MGGTMEIEQVKELKEIIAKLKLDILKKEEKVDELTTNIFENQQQN